MVLSLATTSCTNSSRDSSLSRAFRSEVLRPLIDDYVPRVSSSLEYPRARAPWNSPAAPLRIAYASLYVRSSFARSACLALLRAPETSQRSDFSHT